MSELRNHVVLCGLGHVGSRVLERLRGIQVVAIAWRVSPRARSMASAAGAIVAEGDATDPSVLAQAGAERARAVVAAVVADVVLAVRLEQMLGRTSHHVRGHVVVVGLGRVGYRTACALLDMGCRIIAIEKDAESPFVEEIRRRAAVVIGDARHARTLAAANVAGAESVAALTENDVLNLEIALAARKAAPGIRVVVRTWDRDLADRLARHGGIDRALSASALAAPAFVEAVLRPDVLHAFDWDGRRVEVASGTATAGGNEGVLLSRRAGAEGPWAFTPGSASPGDEVIRVRMPGAQPIEPSAATSAPSASR